VFVPAQGAGRSRMLDGGLLQLNASQIISWDLANRIHECIGLLKVRPVQSADILAWQGAKMLKDRLDGTHKMRADFRALAERDTFMFLGDAENA
jgi:hypothetical protein